MHGANHPCAKAKARRRYERYVSGMSEEYARDMPYERKRKIRSFEAAWDRKERRVMKKAGTLEAFDQQAKGLRRRSDAERLAFERRLGPERLARYKARNLAILRGEFNAEDEDQDDWLLNSPRRIARDAPPPTSHDYDDRPTCHGDGGYDIDWADLIGFDP